MNKTDISHKSIRMLEEQFTKKRLRKTWVPDWGIQYNTKDAEEIDALLMGSYFERIFQLEFWPSQDFFLFCLSPQVKKILVEVFSFDSEVVGHLSRYELFPLKGHTPEPFIINEKTYFYFGGRLSPQKNIEFLILTVFYLQIFYSSEIELTLLGDYDNEYHKDILGCQFLDYQKKIENLISGLPWAGKKPLIINGLGPNEWIKKIPSTGIFISASNLISEDFSITAAQLQNIGRPLLIPFWGGLQDVRGENVRHYQVEKIAHSHQDIKSISRSARLFAENIIENVGIIQVFHETVKSFIPTKKINRDYLQRIININHKKWGASIDYLKSNKLPSFVCTNEGQNVFSQCRKIFSESNFD